MTETPADEIEAPGVAASEPPREPKPSSKLAPRHPVGASTTARMTLIFLGVIFSVCFFAWGGAKMACNHHPPSYQAFKPASLERLAKTPKDAALEFQHRLFIGDYPGARELALQEAADLVAEAESQCDAACKATVERRRAGTLTRATLLERSGATASVKVESQFEQEALESNYELKFESPIWKVLRKAE